MVLLRARVAGPGPLGRPAGGGRGDARRCSTPASRRSSPSTARWARAATSRHSPTARWCCSARAQVATPSGELVDAGEALRGAGITPLVLTAKEGLALINGTDGILGMLVLALDDLRHAAAHGRRDGRHERRGAARHRPRLRTRPAGAAPAPRAEDVGREPDGAARRLGDRGQPPHRRPAGAGRLLAALHAAGARRGARRRRIRRRRRPHRARVGDRQPDGAAGRAHRVLRQLPRRAARPRLRPARHRHRRRSAPSPSGGPTGCSTPRARTACRRS